jgi:hypothetical protein
LNYLFTSQVQGEALVDFFETMAPMTDNSRRTGAAIEAHHQFLTWLVPTVDTANRVSAALSISTTAWAILPASTNCIRSGPRVS